MIPYGASSNNIQHDNYIHSLFFCFHLAMTGELLFIQDIKDFLLILFPFYAALRHVSLGKTLLSIYY